MRIDLIVSDQVYFFLPVHWRYDEPYGGRNNYRYAGEVQRSIASAEGR